MSEKTERIYQNHLTNLPEGMRAFVRSLVVTKIGGIQEKMHDDKNLGATWGANTVLLEEEIFNENKAEVLDRAIFLITLPKHEDEETECYFRWLRGNGAQILQDPHMKESLNTLLDEPESSKPLKDALLKALSTDVTGLTKDGMSDVPESYALLVSLLVCDNLTNEPLKMAGPRRELLGKAEERLKDPEVNRVMAYFGEISDTKSLYARLISFKDWLTYSERWA